MYINQFFYVTCSFIVKETYLRGDREWTFLVFEPSCQVALLAV